jgi:hypothetical protein
VTLPPDIAAIEARHHDIGRSDRRIRTITQAFSDAHADRAALLRAYRELQERAKAEYDRGYAAGSGDEGYYQRTIAELRALNERQLAALKHTRIHSREFPAELCAQIDELISSSQQPDPEYQPIDAEGKPCE